MLNRVGAGRARDDAVLVAGQGAYRSYAHHHPGRYSAFTEMPLGGDVPEIPLRLGGGRACRIAARCPRTAGFSTAALTGRHCMGLCCWK